MVERNCTLPFCFYCLTDNVYDLPNNVIGVEVDHSLDLEGVWWKICLFNLGWEDPILYIDLDVVIQNNVDYMFKDNDNKLKLLRVLDNGGKYLHDGDPNNPLTIPPVYVNTSLMKFVPKNYQQIFNKFIEDPDYNIIHFFGLDRFITHYFQDQCSYWKFTKDYYWRAKASEKYDPQYISNMHPGWITDPNPTFCIVTNSTPDMYIELEKYFL